MSCVAENIKNNVSNKPRCSARNHHAVLACTVLFVTFELWQHQLAACIIMHSEFTLFYELYTYVSLECLLQLDCVCASDLRSYDVVKDVY